VRTSTSQVALRRSGGRGFAYLWLPRRYLGARGAPLALHPSPAHWIHHLEVHDVLDVDGEVAAWLREAVEHAG
jgi:hypothetical protein